MCEGVIKEMRETARRFKTKGKASAAVVQDFHSFRQALNVASADQRLLVYLFGPKEKLAALRRSLRPIASDTGVIGRYHFDFGDAETDLDWRKAVTGVEATDGIFIIEADEFGMKGRVMAERPLSASADELLQALKDSNAKFAATTRRKIYRDHVAKGHDLDIYFKGNVPYGEDRDGDGVIDHRGGPRAR